MPKRYQLNYWKSACEHCILASEFQPPIQACIRPNDMSVRDDELFVRQGCVLAFIRLHNIEPECVAEAVVVVRRKDKVTDKQVTTFAKNERFAAKEAEAAR